VYSKASYAFLMVQAAYYVSSFVESVSLPETLYDGPAQLALHLPHGETESECGSCPSPWRRADGGCGGRERSGRYKAVD
jgi:hypothetical protein